MIAIAATDERSDPCRKNSYMAYNTSATTDTYTDSHSEREVIIVVQECDTREQIKLEDIPDKEPNEEPVELLHDVTLDPSLEIWASSADRLAEVNWPWLIIKRARSPP